jgi:hypothetical protein
MANTSVHFPDGLLQELDRLAAERGVSRNRLIVESCQLLVRSRRCWPDGFFANEHLRNDDLEELQDGWQEFYRSIEASRKSRSRPPL